MKAPRKFTSIRDVIAWGEGQEAQVGHDDHERQALIKSLCLEEIRKIYDQWERDLQQPVDAVERDRILEELRALGYELNRGVSDANPCGRRE